MSDVTRILEQMRHGEPEAASRLLPVVYNELRKLAAQRLSQESPGQTLQATDLVHEAYLRLVDQQQPQAWNSRGHFFAASAEAMRRILIETARRKQRIKHGGELQRQPLDETTFCLPLVEHDLLDLDEALDAFAEVDETKCELVKLRFFAGLTIAETAEVMGISTTTADRYWAYAKAWLYRELSQDRSS